MKNIARMTIAVLALSVGVAHAADPVADTKSAVKGSGTYGTAGCGLGSMAFGNQKGFIQVLAATTNGLFGTQTFGITSGTSNCGEAAVGSNGTKTFIEGNRDQLAKDAARGTGETIETLTALAGCGDPKEVGVMLQSHFTDLFPAQAANTQVSASVIDALRSDTSLACRSIS